MRNAAISNVFQTLVQADQLYLQGRRVEAEKLYRQAKPAFPQELARPNNLPQPMTDPEKLSAGGYIGATSKRG